MDDHQFTKDDETAAGLTDVCAQIVVFFNLYLARIGRPHILWTVHALARAVTKMEQSVCGKRLTRLISYLKCTSSHRQCCLAGDEASA